MSRKKRTLAIILLFLLLLFVPPVWITYREYRQAKLDHALIAAIKAGNDQKALEALAGGANGEARDIGEPPTLREALLHLWNRFRHPGKKEGTYRPALIMVYENAYDKWPNGDDRESGSTDALVDALLEHGAKVDDRDINGMLPMHFACMLSNTGTVLLLLKHGANIEGESNDRETPLILASAFNNSDVVRLLLEQGANIEGSDLYDKMTPLQCAIGGGNPDTVRILLEHGAKIEAKDRDGNTAMDYANNKQPSAEARKIIALLRHHGAK